MKGTSHPKNDQSLNTSGNGSILEVIESTDLSRRRFMQTTVSASVLSAIGGVTMSGIVNSVEAAPLAPGNGFGGIGFDSVPVSLAPVADKVTVPAGYKVELLHAWGDPLNRRAPAWLEDASQNAEAQSNQVGMHHDGMHFFPMPHLGFGASSTEGLLCVNHEYTHEDILHGTEGLLGGAGVTLAKVRKSQAAHGVSVAHVQKTGNSWRVRNRSKFGRRITTNSPVRFSGPAAGHALMKSKKFDIATATAIGLNDGFTGNGTLNNCAHGFTPWGTYLTCEENWNGYFGATSTSAISISDEFSAEQKAVALRSFNRYGVTTTGFGYRWHQADPRFNVDTNPLEPNLFGWVVEIDPFNPNSVPVKRTAMGRCKHESAQVVVSRGNRVAFYMGDDERNEYIYKFVCARAFRPNNASANRNMLDDGTLYVARFDNTPGTQAGSFRGQWLALRPDTLTVIDKAGEPGVKARLRDLPSFAAATDAEVQALILIKTREAADALGATMMDRPEWTAVRTYFQEGAGQLSYNSRRPLEVYCTLTNNSRRGNTPVSANNPDGSTRAASANPPVDAANPRPDNDYGHIIRWREDGNVVTAEAFEWDIFVLCGDTRTAKTLASSYTRTDLSGVGYQGNVVDAPDGSSDLGAPDGLWFDQFGRMWIQTDQVGDGSGDWINIGGNIMACADPNTKEIRRFMTSPPRCEVTGVTNTPDGRTMFVGIQHPGEDAPASNPAQFSNWPQSQFATNSAGQPLPNTPGVSRPRSSVVVIYREDGGIIGS